MPDRSFKVVSLLLASAFSAITPSASMAADTDWGCQIILCAASQNPTWRGVPYCISPMQKLIRAMAKPRFKWPTCPAAASGRPGYEHFDDCPAGYEPSRPQIDGGGVAPYALSQCKKVTGCQTDLLLEESASCTEAKVMERPIRTKPHYLDIPQKNGETKRFWFDLDLP